MPHASLTPLGRQLRSVLANLRPKLSASLTPHPRVVRANRRDSASRPTYPLSSLLNQSRFYHVYNAVRSATAAAASAPAEEPAEYQNIDVEPAGPEVSEAPRTLSRRRLRRRTRVNGITEALNSAGYDEVVPITPRRKRDISHMNVRIRDGRRKHLANFQRHRKDSFPDHLRSQENKLENVLAGFIHHRAAVAQAGQAERITQLNLRQAEIQLLNAKGYNIDDVRMWADIVSLTDSLEAAEALEKHAALHTASVPLFVLLYLLRRPYIKARALRIVIAQTWKILSHHESKIGAEYIPRDTIFLLFIRLVRHAREVWPRSLESLAELLLHHLPRSKPSAVGLSMSQLQTLTHMLNKAMRLLAVPTAFEPFKNNHYQEAAIVAILRFMTKHDPPLQTNREGYRAVILLQLAQRKRPIEQQWAELKALSWPPWKEDRTAMDADITFEDHGMSKAAETLERMREAGYGPLMWEKTASVYAGWDTDGTPTIQTLVLLGAGGFRFTTEATKWAARITATRTAQEAWACFLAYEEKKLPPSQEVYLAIFRKLHREERRQRRSDISKEREYQDTQQRIYPGDTQEVGPLPPSTHLYTYTRTPPPTVDVFYRQLRKRGVVFEAHCLAFLIASANSLDMGVEYLVNSTTQHPQNGLLLHPKQSDDLAEIPMRIFEAFITLLSRFSNVPLPSNFSADSTVPQFHPIIQQFLGKPQYQLNGNHAIVRAADLLVRRRPIDRAPWNAILQSLARPITFRNINSAVIRMTDRQMNPASAEQDRSRGAIMAYRIVRRVLRTMRNIHLDLDPVGFQALCWSVENVALACLTILRYVERNDTAESEKKMSPRLVRVAHVLNFGPTTQLKAEFRVLTGDNESAQEEPEKRVSSQSSMEIRQRLELPSPAVLHAYIRALGWMADYPGLRDTVSWMVTNQDELLLRCKRDRSGEIMMRRTIIAVRVFLERSWLATTEVAHRESAVEQDWVEQVQVQLRQLEAAASVDIVDEVRALIESVDDWCGWPEDEEVEEYCTDIRFASL